MVNTSNDKTVTVKLTRGEVCRLLILITGIGEGESWKRLHHKIRDQLEEFDQKQKEKSNA